MRKYKKAIRILGSTISLACFLLSSLGCASNGIIQPGEEVVVGRTSFSGFAGSNRLLFQEYRVGAGDVLDVLYQVDSWKENPAFKIAIDHVVTVRFVNHPELDQTQSVRPDGMISLGFVGSVRVVGKTVDELTVELKNKYREHLKDTDIYVVLEDFRGSIRELKADLRTTPSGSSRPATVRSDGYATFVMVGDLYVAGKTVKQISADLNSAYEKMFPGLTVDVFLEQHLGSQVYVFGEVNTPGAYSILRPTSLFEAIAMAGSITPAARLDSIIVFRQKEDQVLATRVDLKELLAPVKSGGMASKKELEGYHRATSEMFYLHPDDIVFVSRRRLNSAAAISREVSDLLFFRGWGFSAGYDLDDR